MRMLTVDEVAAMLRLPRGAVYRLASEHRIPVVRIGKRVRIPADSLQAWIEAGGAPLPGGWRREPDVRTAAQ